MKQIIFYLSLSLLIISCTDFKNGFVPDGNSISRSEKDSVERILINPENFFYLKLEEYFETFEYEPSDDIVSRNNEASALLYRSVHRDSVNLNSTVVEEKYLYLENYDKDTIGRIIYFKTARYVNDQKLKRYYTDYRKIHINTAKQISLGYWYFQQSDSTYHLLMTNGSKKYQVVAKGDSSKISFTHISHPNIDRNSREIDSDQLIEVKSVMNVGKDNGLVFYRNIPSSSIPERAVVYEESHDVNLFVFAYQDTDLKNIISNVDVYIKVEDGGVFKKRNNYMNAYVIPTFDRKLFLRDQKVVRRSDKKAELENSRGG